MEQFRGLLGIFVLLALAYAFSTNRRAIRLKTVAWGLGLQFVFALMVIYSDRGQRVMAAVGDKVNRLLSYAFAGSSFVFGNLGLPADPSLKLPFLPEGWSKVGFVFAFQVLPTIIFISALFAVLYYLGVMQLIIRAMAWVMSRFMGVSGAESLDVAASIFMGQTEAPLTIRPLLSECTTSELMTIMTAGMAHVSGGIMAAYIQQGVEIGRAHV